jgi:hypothetical protein
MRCPKCKNLETRVIDSRLSEDGLSIRRRRECEKCGARFTTFERMEFVSFFVNKTSGKNDRIGLGTCPQEIHPPQEGRKRSIWSRLEGHRQKVRRDPGFEKDL